MVSNRIKECALQGVPSGRVLRCSSIAGPAALNNNYRTFKYCVVSVLVRNRYS